MATSASPEAFLLLTLPNATLRTPTQSYSGTLNVDYVTFSLPPFTSASPSTPDALLILRVGEFDAVLDPHHAITQSKNDGDHRFVFHSAQAAGEMVLILPSVSEKDSRAAEDFDAFESILAHYGNYQGSAFEHATVTDIKSPDGAASTSEGTGTITTYDGEEDLRGRFVLVDEDNGKVLGALDNHIHVQEDPSLRQKGHETDPVVVELPEGVDSLEQLSESQVMVRTVPPEERDWLFKGAVLASHVISGGTTLLTTAMNTASDYYVAHSKPVNQNQQVTPAGGTKSPDASNAQPSTPSRTLLLLSSPTTRKHLTKVHAVSGKAVQLSNKTAATVEGMIQRVVGSGGGKSTFDSNADKSKGGAVGVLTASATDGIGNSTGSAQNQGSLAEKPPLPARKMADSGPPPYSQNPPSVSSLSESDKPTLPPRKLASDYSSDSPFESTLPVTGKPPALPERGKGSSKKRGGILLSAALILSALSESSTRLVEGGGNALSKAVAHKYGEPAGQNVRIAAGAVRNVALVYVDVRGFGRKAIVKKVAGNYVKGKIKDRKEAQMKGN